MIPVADATGRSLSPSGLAFVASTPHDALSHSRMHFTRWLHEQVNDID